MHSHLHATTCYVDLRLFGISRHQDDEVMSGLYEAIGKLIPDPSNAYSVRSQFRAYILEEEGYLEPNQRNMTGLKSLEQCGGNSMN
jgi:hypothetical protein